MVSRLRTDEHEVQPVVREMDESEALAVVGDPSIVSIEQGLVVEDIPVVGDQGLLELVEVEVHITPEPTRPIQPE